MALRCRAAQSPPRPTCCELPPPRAPCTRRQSRRPRAPQITCRPWTLHLIPSERGPGLHK
eukprot:scaffold8071_cov116-Isochrysis_galbana.AAC.2